MSGPPGLLEQLLNSEADPDYRSAAAARGSTAPPHTTSRSLGMLAAVAVFGILLGVSAVKTERDRPQALVERTQLVAAISTGQRKLDVMHTTLRTLESGVARLQTGVASSVATQTRLSDLASTLGVGTGTAPVRGPGLLITVDDSPDAVPGAGGVILDSDLQLLVNGLWAAGAEAIAINGHRLTTRTAIHFAGQAITVNYSSLRPPYVVAAIGNPDTLPARFLETSGGQVWLGLRANFGIKFQTHSEDQIDLAGNAPGPLRWMHQGGPR